MDIVVVKGGSGQRDRMWVTRSDGSTEQVPINMVHDLPHLVVESAFGLEFGFWGLIDAGAFAHEIHASHAREPKRAKQGRHGVLLPLSGEVVAAKALTNAFRDYGDTTAQGIRERLAVSAEQNAVVRDKLESLADSLIERVQSRLTELTREWRAVPPGGRMHLQWPLATSPPTTGRAARTRRTRCPAGRA